VLAPDVNVLVYAFREELPEHEACRRWLEAAVQADEAYGLFDLVLSGFLRIVTHPRVFKTQTPLDAALDFYCNKLGLRESFRREDPKGRFTLVFLMAPGDHATIDQSKRLGRPVTTDRDYSGFAGLRVHSPLV